MVGSHFTDEISKCIQEMANNVEDEDQHRNVADVLATYGGRISQLKLLKHTDNPGRCGEKITRPHDDSAAESALDRRLSIRRGAFVKNKDTVSMLIPKGHDRTPSIVVLREEVDNLEMVYCPPEWNALNSKTRIELTRLLSWDNLARWDFNILTVTELSKDTMKVSSSAGYNYGQCCPLLLVGWAILCAPMAQQAMEGSLGSSDSVVSPSCSDKGSNVDAFPYPFSDLIINPERICNFLREVESRYDPELPYHNNIHAADVTQTLHCLLQMIGKENLYAIYEPVDIFSVLLAATFHDVGHPGLNNLYHKNARLELAILYNDSSILENMHSAVGQSLLLGEEKQTKWDIFQPWDCTQIDRARSVMISAVLGTDMGNHFESVGKLADLVEKLRTSESAKLFSLKAFSFVSSLNSTSSGAKQVVPILTILAGVLDSETANPRDESQGMMRTVEMLSSRQKEKESTPQERESREKECTHLADFILKFLVHAADISNPAKKLELSNYWTDRVYDEFFAQGRYCFYLALFGRVSSSDSSHVSMNFPLSTGDKEKELGLPISPLCDRDTVKKADSQIGFLKFVVRPTYLLLGAILPNVTEMVIPSIDEQIRYWGQKKAKILLQDGLSNVKVMSGVIQSLSSYRLEN
jgi:hypothetical protein